MSLTPRNRRLSSALLVLALLVSSVVAMSTVCYCVGSQSSPDYCFFDPNRAPTRDEANIAQLFNYALQSDEKNAAIFIGDSTCAASIDPAALNVPAWNLGSFRGFGPSGFLLLTRAYLQQHPRPDVVVLIVNPFSVEVDPTVAGSAEYAQRVAPAYTPQLAGTIPRIASLARRGAARISCRTDVRNMPLVGLEQETFRTREAKLRNGRGFLSLPGAHAKGGAIGVPERPRLAVHPDWDRGVRSIAETCRAAGVRLLIRFGPIDQRFRDARDWSLLERWADSLDGATVAKPLIIAYPPELMWDGIHLNRDGVDRFMPVVAKDVKRVLAREIPRAVASTVHD
jgi:hypothetical protein